MGFWRVFIVFIPSTTMFELDGTSVTIDFGSCRKIGESLEDAVRTKRLYGWHDPNTKIVLVEKNDLDAFAELRTWLIGLAKDFLFEEKFLRQ